MKNITIDTPGLDELNRDEIQNIAGGLIWIPAGVLLSIVLSAISNFGDIRQGFADGWSGLPPRYLN